MTDGQQFNEHTQIQSPALFLSYPLANSCDSPLLGGASGAAGNIFSASSTFNNYSPQQAKLHNTLAWCSKTHHGGSTLLGNEYLRIILPSLTYVTGLKTQGATLGATNYSAVLYKIYYTKTASGSPEFVVKNSVTGLPMVRDCYELWKLTM